MEVDEGDLAPDEVAEALDQIDTGSETEGSTPEPAPVVDRAPHLQAVDAVSVSSADEYQECLPATEEEAQQVMTMQKLTMTLTLDEFATRLSSIPDMTQAKDVLTLHQLGGA
ncbi:unnamed protein product [Effrenium voratum]|nr:unnamed protein product [Effrenium voratum]